MSYGIKSIVASDKYRYLIKFQGNWRRLDTYDKDPDWDRPDVTDVISLPHEMAYNEPRWRIKNSRRYILREPAIVDEGDLTLILLQVRDAVDV